MAEKKWVNICGIPASEIKKGVCRFCGGGTYCHMEPSMMIEERVYDYAVKHGLTVRGKRPMFSASIAREMLGDKKFSPKVPKYFRDAVSCCGKTFDNLDSFPQDVMLRVCHDSDDGTFQVGDLVWRHSGKHANSDGINFVREAGCLEPEDCDKALRGAHFEEAYRSVPNGG